MKAIYFLLVAACTGIILYLSPGMDHKSTTITSVQHVVQGRVQITMTASGSYPSKDGKHHVLYGITTTGEPVALLLDKATDTAIPTWELHPERSYTATGEIVSKGLMKADALEATKTIPTPHETMTLALDNHPRFESSRGHQHRYSATLNGQPITLIGSGNQDPERTVVGYWQPNRQKTFVII